MPIVIPAAPGSASSAQSVPTQNVFDYLYDSQGNPRKGAPVIITLNVEVAYSITPQVSLINVVVQATTDNNGFWSVSLIPNANINPANTTYSVQIPGQPVYEIQIPSAGGPFQSTSPSVLVNTPGVLAPATTGITGNLTVAGNETVTGTLSVAGATTLAGTTVGALATAAISAGGDVTIGNTFRLLFATAASKIVGGATSLSVRDNADANDNLLVSNAGDLTVRARLLLASAAAKIIGGATSLSLRNNADNADNVLVADAGSVTLRNALNVPASAGGTLPTTSYGTLPVKFDQQAPNAVPSITIPASGTIPGTFSKIRIGWKVRCTGVGAAQDIMQLTFNGDSGNHYNWSQTDCTTATPATTQASGVAFIRVGSPPQGGVTAGVYAQGWIEIVSYADATGRKMVTAESFIPAVNYGHTLFSGDWTTTNAAVTSITIALSGDNYAAGSFFITELYP